MYLMKEHLNISQSINEKSIYQPSSEWPFSACLKVDVAFFPLNKSAPLKNWDSPLLNSSHVIVTT
jgi:hypothetical protein